MGSVLEPENRYIILKGLNNIHNSFFLQLMDKQAYSITGKMSPTHAELIEAMNPISVAFYIVPLINATIRVGTIEEKTRLFEAFLDGDKMIPSNKRGAKGTLEKAGIEAARECTNARARQNRLLDNAIANIETKIYKLGLLDNRILFIRLEDDYDFPSELNGLLAMKLSQQFQRPTIVARLNKEGYDRGSMRGLNQSELTSFKDFLESSGYFEYVSGHDNAAGASLKDSDLRAFHEWANIELSDIDFGENVYDINFQRSYNDDDLKVLITDLSNQKVNKLWGQGCAEPIIHITNIPLKSSMINVIGKNQDTLRFEINGITYLKFRAKELIEKLKELNNKNLEIDLVGTANLNEWGGKITPQIFIEDLDYKIDEGIPSWARF